MNSDLTVKVAVENTTYVFDKLFDYLVPSAFTDLVQVGKRVLVPFGRGNKKKQGIIFELSPVSDDIPVEKLKSICSVLDDEPVLSKELLKLAEFMKEHYFCTYYDAVKTMLPAGINYKITTLYGVREGVDEEEIKNLISTESFMSIDDFSAYTISEGTCRSLIDESTGLISENELDSASEYNAEVFDKLYQIYIQKLQQQ